jgi:RNA polymerase sigma-70 factor, ECF subfamily
MAKAALALRRPVDSDRTYDQSVATMTDSLGGSYNTPYVPEAVTRDHSSDFDSSFATHYARLVRTLSVACGDATLAEDCVQEAFSRAHLRWDKLVAQGDPVGWVYVVAVNQVRDHSRRVKRWAAKLHLLADRDTHDAPPFNDQLSIAVASLPTQQRLAVALFYVADMSIEQVAATMELSAGAVKFHLHQARTRLRQQLEGGNL